MKISGFTMAKNAVKLYYPWREAIESILPICDEFIVALGDCDPDDSSREELAKINSDKIKIIDTVWDLEKYPRGMENAHQTDIAKNACTGDWCFYLQADEVVHEKYLETIRKNCEHYFDDTRVEGFLFQYRHFYGDYRHYNDYHGWYPNEIRIVRNEPEIHSFESAQSFRRMPKFDGLSYRDRENSIKLNVVEIDAYIYHYGWVRPPHLMQKKSKSLETIHKGRAKADELYSKKPDYFEYGPLGRLPVFGETHPAVMKDMISRFGWADKLDYSKSGKPLREPMGHEKFKSRALTFLERNLFGGRQLFGYSNWNIVEKSEIKGC